MKIVSSQLSSRLFKNVLLSAGTLFIHSIGYAQWTAPSSTATATTPIRYDGNVGFGTGATVPAGNLHVLSNSAVISTIIVDNNSSNTSKKLYSPAMVLRGLETIGLV